MKKLLLPLIFLLMFSFYGCEKQQVVKEKSETAEFFAMDTYCSVTVYGETGNDFENITKTAVGSAQKLLTSSSENNIYIAQVENQTLNLSEDATRVIAQAFEINELSAGAFDITIAPLTQMWDVTNRTVPPTESEVLFAQSFCGSDKLSFNEKLRSIIFLKPGSGIDIGSIGKGYAGDKVAKALSEEGYSSGMINLGGNITVFGKKQGDKPFVVGIKDPLSDRSDATVGRLIVDNCSVITSGAYERCFTYEGKRYHHIIDPKTGYPTQNDLLSVTIIANDGVYGDALSTAAFVVGPETAEILLQNAIEKGYITGAVLVNNKRTVKTIGNIDFTISNGEYNEG
ncbi:MAG: hypothetical protein DBX47_00685 [Clostridiales bacterium]|nr:MAG: hypothetical protein DBX47_00685 [Clostridiales bacterium]